MAEEGFHDYTLATKLERLVAQMEQCFRGWMLTGLENISHLPPALGADKQPINLVRVSSRITHRMPWRSQPYTLTLHVPYTREADLRAARQAQQHQQQQQAQNKAQALIVAQHQEQRHEQCDLDYGKPQLQTNLDLRLEADGAMPIHPQGLASSAGTVPDRALAAASHLDFDDGGDDNAAQSISTVNAAATAIETGKATQQLPVPLVSLSQNDAGPEGSIPQQQLHQQIEELIQQYHQLHLQLQEDADQRQQQQQQAHGDDSSIGDVSGVDVVRESSADSDAGPPATPPPVAAAAEPLPTPTSSLLDAAHSAGSSTESTPQLTTAAHNTSSAGQLWTAEQGSVPSSACGDEAAGVTGRLSKPDPVTHSSLKTRPTSSTGAGDAVWQESTAASDAGAVQAAEEGFDEATSRQVQLPAPEQLAEGDSKVLAAVKAAVQLDQSQTAASRSWWPFCFDMSHEMQVLHSSWGTHTPHETAQQQLLHGIPSRGSPWWSPASGGNKLQRWFGLDLFVLLQPASYSRRFLDEAEYASLLSVARLALSSGGVCWPLLLPVHDALRDAYFGVAQVGGVSVQFRSDSLHTSRLPRHLSRTEQQLSLLAEQLAPRHPAASTACLAVLGQKSTSTTLLTPPAAHNRKSQGRLEAEDSSSKWLRGRIPNMSSLRQGALVQQQQQQQHLQEQAESVAVEERYGVWMSACYTYRLPDASRRFQLQHLLSLTAPADIQQQQQPTLPHQPSIQKVNLHNVPETGHVCGEDEESDFLDWDADCTWHPWAQHRDPVQALELDVVWKDQLLNAAGRTPDLIPEASSLLPDAEAGSPHGSTQAGALADVRNTPALRPTSALSPAGMTELLSDVASADVWLLHVLQHGFSSAPARSGRLGVKGYERHRRHVRVEAAGADWLWTADAAHQVLTYGGRLSGVCPQPWGFPSPVHSAVGPQLDPGSFTTMLSALLTARTAASAAHSLWDLSGSDWWECRGESPAPPLPPDSVFDSVLRDLLSPPRPQAHTPTAAAASAASASGCHSSTSSSKESMAQAAGDVSCSSSSSGNNASPFAAANAPRAVSCPSQQHEATGTGAAAGAGGDQLPRSAPPGSLLCRLALHALVFGNARAVAELWQRFVAQARLQFWEQRTLLPHLPSGQQMPTPAAAGSSSTSARGESLSSSFGSFSSQCMPEPKGLGAVGSFTAAAAAPSSSSSSNTTAGGPPAPDLDSCLVHQKLQMLNMCIWRRDKRLTRGVNSRTQQQQQQQQQQRTRQPASRHASNSSILGSKSNNSIHLAPSSSNVEELEAELAAAGAEDSSSSGKPTELSTAASSTFFSTTGDDEEDGREADVQPAALSETALPSEAAVEGLETLGDEGSEESGGQGSEESGGQGLAESGDIQRHRVGSGAAAARGDSPLQPQKVYEDANSEFYSLGTPLRMSSGGNSAEPVDCESSAPSAAARSGSTVEPQGVAAVVPGQHLLLYPDRPLRVPILQDGPVFTEDQMLQRQTALLQLATAAAAAASSPADLLLLKQRLLAAPVLSDMCAFKAANPGCCFDDFLRWYSPKDWQPQQHTDVAAPEPYPAAPDCSSQAGPPDGHHQPAAAQQNKGDDSTSTSTSVTTVAPSAAAAAPPSSASGPGRIAPSGQSNDWHQLWQLAEAQPAAAQRPLLNPQKEGELVLHYLETLRPSALFSQLLAAAVCEALHLLASSRGAALPAAAAVVQRFRPMAAGVLRKGGGLSEALAAAALAGGPPGREQQQDGLAGDYQGAEDGLSDVELELLLAEFSYVEQVVVLGESLLHHLPGQKDLAAQLLHNLLHGADAAGAAPATPSAAPGSNLQAQGLHKGSAAHPAPAGMRPAHTDAAAASILVTGAGDATVMGAGTRLPVACLSLQQRHALLRWVAACMHTEQGSNHGLHPGQIRALQVVQQQQQQQPWGSDGQHHSTIQHRPWGPEMDHHHQQQQQQSKLQPPTDQSLGSHLQGLTSPRDDWPDPGTLAPAALETNSSSSKSPPHQPRHSTRPDIQQQPVLHDTPHAQQQHPAAPSDQRYVCKELRRLQGALGVPAQQEWVTTCGPLPDVSLPHTHTTNSPVFHQQVQQSPSCESGAARILKPAVAAAVAAMSGCPADPMHPITGAPVPISPVPPSRLYVQEADGEMRLATLLVSQPGL